MGASTCMHTNKSEVLKYDSHAHLGSGVLHAHAIRAQLEVALATLDVGRLGLVQVRVHNLLGERQRCTESADINN